MEDPVSQAQLDTLDSLIADETEPGWRRAGWSLERFSLASEQLRFHLNAVRAAKMSSNELELRLKRIVGSLRQARSFVWEYLSDRLDEGATPNCLVPFYDGVGLLAEPHDQAKLQNAYRCFLDLEEELYKIILQINELDPGDPPEGSGTAVSSSPEPRTTAQSAETSARGERSQQL